MIPYFVPDMPTSEDIIPYLRELDNSKWYSNFGPLYKQFRTRLALECLEGIDENRLTIVSSGTSAIELTLRALDLPRGSKVLTTGFTFPATISAILNTGLLPCLCDIDNEKWQLTPERAESCLATENYAAILPVCTFGMPVDSEKWAAISQQYNIPVVIDAAPALLNQRINSTLYYAFSLHTTKPIGVGEGGLVVSPNNEFAEQIRKSSNFGFDSDRIIRTLGGNAKISEYHCAVGLAQLNRLSEIKEKRLSAMSQFQSLFENISAPISSQPHVGEHIPTSLYIKFESADVDFISNALARQGVETRRLYWPLIQDLPAFTDNTEILGAHYVAQEVSKKSLAIPFHNHLQKEDIQKIVGAIESIYENKVKNQSPSLSQ